MQNKLFQELGREGKIDFFVHCQNLLIKYHPKSPFTFRYDNMKERLKFTNEFCARYKGYCFQDDNICILYNRVLVQNPRDPIKVIKDHIYQPPQEKYNALSVDFVVFRELRDCIEFCKTHYSPRLEYILFVKNNEVKLYNSKKLLSALKVTLKNAPQENGTNPTA